MTASDIWNRFQQYYNIFRELYSPLNLLHMNSRNKATFHNWKSKGILKYENHNRFNGLCLASQDATYEHQTKEKKTSLNITTFGYWGSSRRRYYGYWLSEMKALQRLPIRKTWERWINMHINVLWTYLLNQNVWPLNIFDKILPKRNGILKEWQTYKWWKSGPYSKAPSNTAFCYLFL